MSKQALELALEALEKLARLGNEPHYGNSKGNDIAIAALAALKEAVNRPKGSEMSEAEAYGQWFHEQYGRYPDVMADTDFLAWKAACAWQREQQEEPIGWINPALREFYPGKDCPAFQPDDWVCVYTSAPAGHRPADLTIPESKTAKERFAESFGETEEEPIERLRFFCSLAMNSQDWLDVEPFFDDVIASPPEYTGEE